MLMKKREKTAVTVIGLCGVIAVIVSIINMK